MAYYLGLRGAICLANMDILNPNLKRLMNGFQVWQGSQVVVTWAYVVGPSKLIACMYLCRCWVLNFDLYIGPHRGTPYRWPCGMRYCRLYPLRLGCEQKLRICTTL